MLQQLSVLVAGFSKQACCIPGSDQQCTPEVCLAWYADPLPVEEMYINRSTNPDKPEWIGVRGSSKQEGYHSHLHRSLPGNYYSPVLAHAIVTLFNHGWNGRSRVNNAGGYRHNFDDLWQRNEIQQLVQEQRWDYPLVHHGTAPATSDERFGLEYDSDPADEAAAKQPKVCTVTHELSDEQEQLLFESSSSAMPLQGNCSATMACALCTRHCDRMHSIIRQLRLHVMRVGCVCLLADMSMQCHHVVVLSTVRNVVEMT